jgi:cation:H+ antiporter
VHPLGDLLECFGLVHPLSYAAAVVAASWLVLWRVEACLERGLEGTALGTVLLPYCSGLGNLIFVGLMLRENGAPEEVIVNAVVNNVTNLTLLLGLPALVWGLVLVPAAGRKSSGGRGRGRSRAMESQLSRLSVLLTLVAVGFFTGAVAWMARDGRLDGGDGALLIGMFLFWQCFQVYDTLKHNLQRNVRLGPMVLVDVVLVLVAAWLMYESLEWLVNWLTASSAGFFRAAHLGWITGWLLVLPNALIAVFYAARRRADIVYSSQVGDGHICIPLCLGIAAVVRPVPVPPMLELGVALLLGAALLHAVNLLLWGRLPRPMAAVLVLAYGWFVHAGLAG